MKKQFYPILAIVILISSAFISVATVEWKIKDDFSIKFISKDPSGIFKDFKGTILFDENNLVASKFDLSIDVSSISTGNGMMNKKAQIEEWFDSEKFPQIKFLSSTIVKNDKGYLVSGSLKIKGTSKVVKIPLLYSISGENARFKGTFNVKRSDFKVGKKSDAVPDVMKIEFDVPVTKK